MEFSDKFSYEFVQNYPTLMKQIDINDLFRQKDQIFSLLHRIGQFIFDEQYFLSWINSGEYDLELVKICIPRFKEQFETILSEYRIVEKLELSKEDCFFGIVLILLNFKDEFVKLAEDFSSELTYDHLEFISNQYINLSTKIRDNLNSHFS